MDFSGIRFAAAGNLLIDVIAQVPDGFSSGLGLVAGETFHAQPEDAERVVAKVDSALQREAGRGCRLSRSAGGCSAVAASVAAALGARVSCHGSVGGDAAGGWYAGRLASMGVEPHLMRSWEPTGHFIALHEPSGLKTVLVSPSAAFDSFLCDPGQLQECSPGILHLDALLEAREGTIARWMDAGRAAGMIISLDLSTRGFVARHRERLLPLAARCDIAFANEGEAFALTGCVENAMAESRLAELNPAMTWILKRGANGVVRIQGDIRQRIEAPEARVIDDTGAGDAFAGAYLMGACAGLGTETCLAMGKAAAGIALGTLGTGFDPNGLKEAILGVI